MSKVWCRSKLKSGDSVTIPNSLFIETTKSEERLLSVKYIGETDAGIFVECRFQPSFGTREPDGAKYKLMINWASIWCGQVKVYDAYGNMIRARRKKPIVREVVEDETYC